MTSYRFLDGSGEVVAEQEFDERDEALAWAMDGTGGYDVQRVEFRGPEGDWRWAGPLLG